MPRIAGVNIPENKKIDVALTYVYGIGPTLSKKILEKAKIDKEKRANKLSSEEISKLRDIVEQSYQVEGDLRQEKNMNIKRLKDISCYRGSRHQKGLPSRGQRTKTNNRTVRGNLRRTMGSGRQKAAQKT